MAYKQRWRSIPLAGWPSWLEHCPLHQKDWGFDSRSGHIPRLQVWSPVGMCQGGNWSMFLSLSLSLCKINKHISENFFKDLWPFCKMTGIQETSYEIKTILPTPMREPLCRIHRVYPLQHTDWFKCCYQRITKKFEATWVCFILLHKMTMVDCI